MKDHTPRLGRRIRALRLGRGLTQAALANRLGISASYLNLIEHEKRPVSATLLIRLAQRFDLDLKMFATEEATRREADLREVFGDPLFDEDPFSEDDVRELVHECPEIARGVLRLYHAYREAHESVRSLADRVHDQQELGGVDRTRVSSEQVSDFIQAHMNHFPELEEEAEAVAQEAGLEGGDLFAALSRYLERTHGVEVRILEVGEMGAAVRRFDERNRVIELSEVLRRGSRNFQLVHQIGLLHCSALLDRVSRDPQLPSEESRALGRVALANYFAAAVLMPYRPFLRAAEEVRYDLELLGHRFRASFEQVCHRLTTLGRRGARGIPFHMVRIDIAGNISKKFSATGIRLPRFGGLCPLWGVHASFQQPGRIRVQHSRLPDGTQFFSVARAVRKHRGGFHSPQVLFAIGLGTDVESARRMVYADGFDLSHLEAAVPVGVTCRLCERMGCEARAFPPVQKPIRIDENVRGISFYAPIVEEEG